MTVDELKIEAKKLGYNIIKKAEYIKLLPCKCGKKYPMVWSYMDGFFYKCPKCGAKSKMAKTEREARINWNNMVEQGSV